MAMSVSTVIRGAQPGADDDAVVLLMTNYMTWAHERLANEFGVHVRWPARVTTAAWPDSEQEQTNGAEGAAVEAGATRIEAREPDAGWAQPEVEYEPVGSSWAQQVQPFPPVVTDEVEPARSATEESTPAAMPFTDDEWASQGGAAEQQPMDETPLFYAYEDGGDQPVESDEEETQRVFARDLSQEAEQPEQQPEPDLPVYETRETEEQEQVLEPEPVLPADEEKADATPESEPETETVKIQRTGTGERKRPKAGRGRTEDQADATKDTSETL
jgi:hypothetical protein